MYSFLKDSKFVLVKLIVNLVFQRAFPDRLNSAGYLGFFMLSDFDRAKRPHSNYFLEEVMIGDIGYSFESPLRLEREKVIKLLLTLRRRKMSLLPQELS